MSEKIVLREITYEQMSTLVTELTTNNFVKDKEIERLNNIINELEKKIISICETCYEDRETARIEKWIKELKGSSKE